MNKQTFEEVYEEWNNRNKNSKESFYPKRARKYGYLTAESFRSSFRRARKKFESDRRDGNLSLPSPKILLLDAETTPLLCFSWGIWDQRIPPSFVEQDWTLLSWSAKWLFEPEMMSDVLTPNEAKRHDDRRIAKSIWKLLDEADICIGHNLKRFDLKKFNTRFLLHDLLPPSYYSTIDTLLVARNKFGFTSNKLDEINKFLGIEAKTDTEFDLWRQCFYGNPEALKKMVSYNENDVAILEDLYIKLRPWMTGHPNLGLYMESNGSVCPNCGSANLTWKGYTYTPMNRYCSFRCECGAIGRAKKTDLSKVERQKLVR